MDMTFIEPRVVRATLPANVTSDVAGQRAGHIRSSAWKSRSHERGKRYHSVNLKYIAVCRYIHK